MLGCGQSISVNNNAFNLVPVNVRKIDPESYPTSGSKISWDVEPVRSKIGKTLVGSLFGFAVYCNTSVAMMVIKIVAKPPSPNLKA